MHYTFMFCLFIQSFNRKFTLDFVNNGSVFLDPVIYWKNGKMVLKDVVVVTIVALVVGRIKSSNTSDCNKV